MNLPVMTLGEAAEFSGSAYLVSGVGGSKREAFILRAIGLGFQFVTLVHPACVVSKSAVIGTGTAIRAGCVVAANVRIGQHVMINRGCLVGHDVVIGDFARPRSRWKYRRQDRDRYGNRDRHGCQYH